MTPPPLDDGPLPPRGIVTIEVERGVSAEQIGEQLEQARVVRSSRQFESLAELLGYADLLQAAATISSPASPRCRCWSASARA